MPAPALTRADADALIRRFDGLKPKVGGGWTAKCPAHEDRQASLSIDIKNGKVLLKCFAGCDAAVIAAGKGLTLADLFLESSPTPSRVPPTVDSLAAAKGLPVEVLRRYGVRNVADLSSAERFQHGIKASEGVWIPYFNQDGSLAARTRIRSAHIAKDGSTWAGSFGAPLPYGLHDMADAATQGIVVICEGETDYWSLRAMGVPAIGLPGATTVGGLTRGYLPDSLSALYVAQDSDAAGAGFAAKVSELAASWGLPCYPVHMPAGCKDVNDVYRRDPATAADRFMALLAAAAAKVTAMREFSTAGEIYRLTLPEWGLALELDQVARKWGDLTGELAILRDTGPDVFRGSVNLSNVERRQGVALQIAKRAQGLGEIDWPALIEDFALRSLKAERQGPPGVWLDEVTPRPADLCVQVTGFDVPLDLPACLFGDGDTGKSFLALHVLGELARRGIACGIVDAEMEDRIHAERLGALFGAQQPRIAHLRLDRPLALSVDHVRRFVRDKGLKYLAYDSVGFLTPEPEKSESALSYMRAIRQVGAGSLSIAHVTKVSQDVKPEQQKPFGSNFYYQSFRRIWYAQAEAEPDSDGRKVIGVWDRKANTSRKRPPFGLALTVRDGFASVEPCDLGGSDELAAKLPLWKRLERLLVRGPQTVSELAEALDETDAKVKVELNRKRGVSFVALPDSRPAKWALVTRTVA